MKYVVGLLWLAAVAIWGVLWLNQDVEVKRTIPSETLTSASNFAFRRPLIVNPSQVLPESPSVHPEAEPVTATEMDPPTAAQASASVSATAGAPMRIEDAPCLVLAPVAESALSALNPLLRDAGLLERIIIQPYELESLVVYAGPYTSETAAKRAQRNFARTVTQSVIRSRASGDYIVELARFSHRQEAQRWAEETARTLQAHNIAVGNTGTSEGKVQIVFPNLSADENTLVRRAFSRAAEGAQLLACWQ